MEDRREEFRRLEDYRFTAIEHLLETLQETLAITELDKRYMPRNEMATVFITRRDHLKEKETHTELSVKIALGAIAFGQLAVAIIIAIQN